jgi:hypothetical protein
MLYNLKFYLDIIFFGFAISFQQLGFNTENFPIFLFLFIIYKFVDYNIRFKLRDLLNFLSFTIIIIFLLFFFPTHWKLIFIPALLLLSFYYSVILYHKNNLKIFEYGLILFIFIQYAILFLEGFLDLNIIGLSRVTQNIFNFSGSFFEPSYIALFCVTIKSIKIVINEFKYKHIIVHLLLDILIFFSGSFWGFLLLPFVYLVFFFNNKLIISVSAIPLSLIFINLPAFDRFYLIFSQVNVLGIFQVEQSGFMRFAPFVNALILFWDNLGTTVITSNDSLRSFINSNVNVVDPVVLNLLGLSNYIIPSIATALLLTGLYTIIPFLIMIYNLGLKPSIKFKAYGFLFICVIQFLFQSLFTSPFIFSLWFLLCKKNIEKKVIFFKY